MVARMNGSSATFMKKSLFCSVALSCFALRTIGQTTAPPPATAVPQRAAEVDRRGDLGMGFGHDMTSHHFHLLSDGGAIEVESNSPDDDTSKEAIRRHMQKIAGMFGQGDFSLPMFIHDTVPPGVEVMKRLKDQIAYTTENTAKGAQVRIATRTRRHWRLSRSSCASRSKTTALVTRWQYNRIRRCDSFKAGPNWGPHTKRDNGVR
jgi:hypothetical protein